MNRAAAAQAVAAYRAQQQAAQAQTQQQAQWRDAAECCMTLAQACEDEAATFPDFRQWARSLTPVEQRAYARRGQLQREARALRHAAEVLQRVAKEQ